MRDIDNYADEYTSSDFERILSRYRISRMVELIKRYQYKRLLEVGCALWPLALSMTDLTEYTLVEAAEKYMENAKWEPG